MKKPITIVLSSFYLLFFLSLVYCSPQSNQDSQKDTIDSRGPRPVERIVVIQPPGQNSGQDEQRDFPTGPGRPPPTSLPSRDRAFLFDEKTKKCLNEKGEEGFNPNRWGQCADLRGQSLADENLSYFDFRGSQMQGANLSGADLDGADFSFAQLAGANFYGVSAKRTSFHQSNLRSAILSFSQFSDADMRCADLSQASAYATDFSLTDFRGAKLSTLYWTRRRAQAIFNGSIYDQQTELPFSRETRDWFEMKKGENITCFVSSKKN